MRAMRVPGKYRAVMACAWLSPAIVCGCAVHPERPARSSAGCAQAVVDRHLPAEPTDKLEHCVAGALIARYCSPFEARLAGVAKEVRDAFTGGDAEQADVQATFAGVRCARTASDTRSIEACCASTCAACSTARSGGDPAR
jgi:hypothetical protein